MNRVYCGLIFHHATSTVYQNQSALFVGLLAGASPLVSALFNPSKKVRIRIASKVITQAVEINKANKKPSNKRGLSVIPNSSY
jgi:hypothetical protein